MLSCRSRIWQHFAGGHPRFLGFSDLTSAATGSAYHRSVTATAAQLRAIERIRRVCRTTTADALSFRLAVLDEVRRVVKFDAYAWLLTDPETEVGSAPLADVPCLPELPRLIRLKYLTPINRWTRLDVPVALLRVSTGDHLERSLVWREMLGQYGVTDVASLVFRCRYGCWGFLDLWRIATGSSFTDGEADFLTAIAKPVTEGLRRCQANTFSLAATATVRVGPVVLVLSPDLEVRAQTPETNEYLKLLVPPDADRQPIPAGAYNVAAQLLSVEAGVDDHPPIARVHLSAGVWLTLRAARIGTASPTAEQDIAVAIEAAAPAERMALFGRACALSARELELLGHLIVGSDTRRIAQQMFLSENTVQDHLKSIFTKTGTSNRRILLARGIGR
jgi:DNA-binding CsgD family transcriptional regulator